MVDLRVPEGVADELEAHVRGGLPLSDRAKTELRAAISHAKGGCACGQEVCRQP